MKTSAPATAPRRRPRGGAHPRRRRLVPGGKHTGAGRGGAGKKPGRRGTWARVVGGHPRSRGGILTVLSNQDFNPPRPPAPQLGHERTWTSAPGCSNRHPGGTYKAVPRRRRRRADAPTPLAHRPRHLLQRGQDLGTFHLKTGPHLRGRLADPPRRTSSTTSSGPSRPTCPAAADLRGPLPSPAPRATRAPAPGPSTSTPIKTPRRPHHRLRTSAKPFAEFPNATVMPTLRARAQGAGTNGPKVRQQTPSPRARTRSSRTSGTSRLTLVRNAPLGPPPSVPGPQGPTGPHRRGRWGPQGHPDRRPPSSPARGADASARFLGCAAPRERVEGPAERFRALRALLAESTNCTDMVQNAHRGAPRSPMLKGCVRQ